MISRKYSTESPECIVFPERGQGQFSNDALRRKTFLGEFFVSLAVTIRELDGDYATIGIDISRIKTPVLGEGTITIENQCRSKLHNH